MTFRVETYRHCPDRSGPLTRTPFCWQSELSTVHQLLSVSMDGAPPGSAALVIEVNGDHGRLEESVVERWRVDATGRVMRQVLVGEREVEVLE